ncbi:MAG: hypothetical protein U9R25_14610 [Chloroflexota bacterium]|nr:hypothetical protein [Chloroflexota bacterium]
MTQEAFQEINLSTALDHLVNAGWDGLVDKSSSELTARLERPPSPGVWTISLDRSGRFRFTATRDVEAPLGERLSLGEREYRLLLETLQVLTIMGVMGSADELPEVLDQLAQLVQKPTGASV